MLVDAGSLSHCLFILWSSNSMWLIDMLLTVCCLPLAVNEIQVNFTIETVPPPGGNAAVNARESITEYIRTVFHHIH